MRVLSLLKASLLKPFASQGAVTKAQALIGKRWCHLLYTKDSFLNNHCCKVLNTAFIFLKIGTGFEH